MTDNKTPPSEGGETPRFVPPREMITGGFSKKADFISYILTGLLLGVLLDWAFGTRPLFVIVFSIVGIGIGYWRLWQASAEMEEEAKNRGHGV